MLVDEPHRFRRVEGVHQDEGAAGGEGGRRLAEPEHAAERHGVESPAPAPVARARVAERAGHGGGVGGDARMAVQHELGSAGRAGGGEHVRPVVRGSAVFVEGRTLQEIPEGNLPAVGEGGGQDMARAGACPPIGYPGVPVSRLFFTFFRFLMDDHGFELLQGAPVDLAQDVEKGDAAEFGPESEHLRSRSPHDVRDLHRPETGVDRGRHRPEPRATEPQDEIRGGIGEPEGYPVAASDAKLGEGPCGTSGGAVQLRQGESRRAVGNGHRVVRRPPADLGNHPGDRLHCVVVPSLPRIGILRNTLACTRTESRQARRTLRGRQRNGRSPATVTRVPVRGSGW